MQRKPNALKSAEYAEILDLLSALRGRRVLTAEDIRRSDEILSMTRWCWSCGTVLEDHNDDDRQCFGCQGAPEL